MSVTVRGASPVLTGLLLVLLGLAGARQAVAGDVQEMLAALKAARQAAATGNLAEAAREYRHALQFVDRTPDAQEVRDGNKAVMLFELASVQRRRWQLDQAEELLRESEKLYKSHNRGSDQAACLSDLGYLAQVTGRYQEAQEYYAEARRLHETLREFTAENPRARAAAKFLIVVAGFTQLVGRYDEAEGQLKLSLKIWPKADQVRAKTFNELGALYTLRGQADPTQFRQARAYFEDCLTLLKAPGNADAMLLADCENNLGWLQSLRGDPDGDAEQYFQSSLARLTKMFDPDTEHPDLARLYANLGAVYHARKDYDRAEANYARSLRIRQDRLAPDHPHVALGYFNLGVLAASRLADGQEKARPEAVADLDKFRRLVTKSLGRVLPFLPEGQQLAFLATQREGLHAALSLGLQQRGNAAVVNRAAEWAINGKGLAQEVLAARAVEERRLGGARGKTLLALRDRLAALSFAGSSADQLQNQRDLLAQMQKEETALARDLKTAGTDRPWVDLAAVRRALAADGSVFIDVVRINTWDFATNGTVPARNKARYVAWIVPPKGDAQVEDLGDAAKIDAAVTAFRQAVLEVTDKMDDLGEKESEEQLRQPLRVLSKMVLEPLRKHAGATEPWVLSPDGALWLIPWAALPLNDAKGAAIQYAVEQHNISYVVNGRDLVRDRGALAAGSPLVLADPDYNLAPVRAEAAGLRGETRSVTLKNFDRVRFKALPGTAEEAAAITPKLGRFGKPVVLLQDKAVKRAFKSVRTPRVVVMATHGFFVPAEDAGSAPVNPLLLCGLALAGANQRAAARKLGADDGILTGLEIAGANLEGTELVVLSACDSGLGEVREGEGVAGLRQAFQLAGARAVLATLWEISDEETPLLMNRYFTNLAAGQGKAEALRGSQRRMIEYRRKDFGAASPLFWAFFTLTGER
jgi:CHAT domain-containing protein